MSTGPRKSIDLLTLENLGDGCFVEFLKLEVFEQSGIEVEKPRKRKLALDKFEVLGQVAFFNLVLKPL